MATAPPLLDRSARPHRLDLLRGIPQLLEHLVGVLANLRWQPAELRLPRPIANRMLEDPNPTGPRVVELQDRVELGDLRARQRRLEIVDRRAPDPLSLQAFDDLRRGQLPEATGQGLADLVATAEGQGRVFVRGQPHPIAQ